MDLGINKHCREEELRQQIAAGQGDFVLEVVRKVRDPDLTDFVLRESLKRSQWPLVSGLMREGLSVARMESVCDQAVADKQWTLVLQLLHDGVSPSELIISELFRNNKVQDLLELFPAGGVPEGLRSLLLLASDRFHQADITLHILRRESVTASQLKEAIKHAFHLPDKTVFLQLLRDYTMSFQAFGQKFTHQHWKKSLQHSQWRCDGGEVKWIFNALYEGGDKYLALLVATSGLTSYSLVANFCWAERTRLDFEPKMISIAMAKLCETDRSYFKFVLEMCFAPDTSLSFRSFLWRNIIPLASQTIREDIANCVDLNCTDEFVRLCKSFTPDQGPMLGKSLGSGQRPDIAAIQELSAFAYTSAVDANHSHFISRVCEEKFSTEAFVFKNMNEMRQLMEIIMNREAWHMLVCVSEGLNSLPFFNSVLKLVERCVFKMLSDQSVWPDIAAALDQWIRRWHPDDCSGGDVPVMTEVVSCMRARLAVGQWAFPVSSVARWCVDNGHFHLGLFLALMLEDLGRVTTAITALIGTKDEGKAMNLAWSFVVVATEQGKFPQAAAMLAPWPMTIFNLDLINRKVSYLSNIPKLVTACEERGLMHWGFALMAHSAEYILEKHHLCQQQLVVDFLVREATNRNYEEVVEALLPRCTDTASLSLVLHSAFRHGRKSLAEQVMCKLDPSGWEDDNAFSKTLLSYVAGSTLGREKRLEMVKLCISAGLSSFQRMQHASPLNRCPLTKALTSVSVPYVYNPTPDSMLVKLLLASGASSHKQLHDLCRSLHLPWLLIREGKPEWEKGCSLVAEAATTPSRLEHLARLAVSYSIGCQPGRADRINSLPLPQPAKDLVKFKDVLDTDLEVK